MSKTRPLCDLLTPALHSQANQPSRNLYMELIGTLFVIALYFLPSVIAAKRDNTRMDAIFILNILLGWTIVGWIAAFIWAFFDMDARPISDVQKPTMLNIADELKKLSELKNEGVLTSDEFDRKKQQLLEAG